MDLSKIPTARRKVKDVLSFEKKKNGVQNEPVNTNRSFNF